MKTVICCFSGTGNSYIVAKDLSSKLNAELLPIPALINKSKIDIDADKLGIVFPVYNHGVPYIIKRFVERLTNLQDKYIFAVSTFADSPCLTHEYLSECIFQKGGRLSGGFTVKMPYNYISPTKIIGMYKSFSLRETPPEKQNELFASAGEKTAEIAEYVKAEKTGTIEIASAGIERLANRLNLKETLQKSSWLKVAGYEGKTNLSYIESITLMDCGFSCEDNCTGCGVCEKICPADNITLDGNRPIWHHKCEQCFACLQWCPATAIQYGKNTAGKKRYHHPDVALADMKRMKNLTLKQKENINE